MAAPVLHLDFETRSAVDLRKVGVYRYAEDPTTSVICLSYKVGDGPVMRWRPGESLRLLAEYVRTLPMKAHNAGFERVIWNAKMGEPRLEPERQDCTMARAAALALPASLAQLSQVLQADVQKDDEGRRLMLQMCKPRTTEPLTWWEDAERMERLQAYCDTDVEAEASIDKIMPALSDQERRVWVLDQRINDRGFAVDLALCRAADDAVAEAKKRADARIWRLTNGAVKRCTEAAKIAEWIVAQGIPCTSVAKGEIEELVLCAQVMGSEAAEEAIRLRRSAARTSTAKFSAMTATACRDGRVRGSLAYHGTSTGRWAGRIVQPQNFPRVDEDRDLPNVLMALDMLRDGMGCDGIELLGEPMEILSKCLRPMIVAGPGMKLVGGDLANIEGRVNAWFAGETWKLTAFRAYDAGEGPDLYRVTAGRILGKAPEAITRLERQTTGKVPELALGYQGGVTALVKMAANNELRVHELVDQALRVATAEDLMRARDQYTKQQAGGLPEETWVSLKTIVNGWRDANPAIVQSWWELQDAAVEAVGAPGLQVSALGGRVAYLVAKGFLWCRLPSGRVLAYAAPRLRWTQQERPDGSILRKLQVEYDGVDSVTKRWTPQRLYGGEQCNHIVQGTARDILVEGMLNVEAAGYPIVLTVHDEVLCEVAPDFGSPAEFEALMTDLSSVYAGLPVAAKAWEGERYAK